MRHTCGRRRRKRFRAAHRDRHRRRCRVRGEARDGGGGRHPAPRRKRRGRRSCLGGSPGRHRAVLVRNRRRRLHGHPYRRRPGHDDRRTGNGADGHASDVLLGERSTLALQRRPLQRSLGRRSRHGGDVGRRARELRDDVAGRGLRPGDSRRAPRICHRPGVVRPGEREPRLVRRRPGERGAVPGSGRNAARRRDRVHESGARQDVRAHRAPGREGVLPRSGRRRARPDRPAPGRQPVGEPRLAFRRDEDARSAHVRRAGAGSDARQLPGARRLLDGPAVERRLDRRGGAEHPRGLRPLAR